MQIANSALIGLGAVGTVYGNLLHKTYGEKFAVIAGGKRGQKIIQEGVKLNHVPYFPKVIAPENMDYKADLLIVCVKNHQLEAAISDMKNVVTDTTIILPLLNGITAKERLSAAFPHATVLYGLSLLIDGLRTSEGVVNTNNGVIQFGYASNEPTIAPDVLAIERYLNHAGIDTKVFPDMIRTVWRKWLLNVAYNQVSAVTGFNFSQLAASESAKKLIYDALLEVVQIAEASQINLTATDAEEIIKTMDSFSPDGKTSMLQDIEAKRLTEVDYFSGTVIEYGRRLNIPTPVNYVLYHIIKSIEQTF